jgi:hypothetical protein
MRTTIPGWEQDEVARARLGAGRAACSQEEGTNG